MTDVTYAASINDEGQLGNNSSNMLGMSADGDFVVFDTYSDNLVQSDANYSNDVFVNEYRVVPLMAPTFIAPNDNDMLNINDILVQ